MICPEPSVNYSPRCPLPGNVHSSQLESSIELRGLDGAPLQITDEYNQSAALPGHIYQLVFAARASNNLEDISSRDRDEYILPFTSPAVSTALQ